MMNGNGWMGNYGWMGGGFWLPILLVIIALLLAAWIFKQKGK